MKLKGEEERLELEDRLGERIDLLRRRSWREQKKRERERMNERFSLWENERGKEKKEREGEMGFSSTSSTSLPLSFALGEM